MNLRRLYQEIWQSPYYRLHPIRTARFLDAKFMLAGSRVKTSVSFLRSLGVEFQAVIRDFERRRAMFEGALRSVESRGGEHGGISLEDGTVLYCLARTLRPQHVIETGIAAGISTMFLSAALVDNGVGHLYSIELPPDEVRDTRQRDGALFDWPDSGVAWAVPKELREAMADRHTVLLEDVRTALPALLARLAVVDMFFHDDLHEADHMLWEYRLVWKHMRDGGILVSDDVNEGWLRFCRESCPAGASLCNIQRLAAARKPACLMVH
jgi:predicted O-methyltransferase YrrM